VQEIEDAFTAAEAGDRPTMIVARTKKGKGAKEVEDLPGKHGKPLSDPATAIEELGGERDLHVDTAKPEGDASPYVFDVPGGEMPTWEKGEEVPTRKAYGEALAALGNIRPDIVALDGEVSNSTHSEDFKNAHPDRYIEMYIAEQQMVAAAVGFQVRRHYRPFASTFAAFLSRAYDFVRMAAISRANICLVGSHAGVSIGEDGPSQMALEDLASLRAVHGSTVLYPSDATSTTALVEVMAASTGVVYMRTTRGATPVIYDASEEFQIGGSKVVLDGDDVTLVGAGITLHEALAAAERLAGEGISARVIDLYSVKPIDAEALVKAAEETGAIVTVEDHWKQGGIGEAVLAALGDPDRAAARRRDRRRGDLRRGDRDRSDQGRVLDDRGEARPGPVEHEDVDGDVGVDVNRAQVRGDRPAEHRFHAALVDVLGGRVVDRPRLADPLLLARLDQGPLRRREDVGEDADDDVVADVGFRRPRATAEMLAVQGDRGVGDLGQLRARRRHLTVDRAAHLPTSLTPPIYGRTFTLFKVLR
jgi:transketolase C-terminal domain/subunit